MATDRVKCEAMSAATVVILDGDRWANKPTGIGEELADLYCARRWDTLLQRARAEAKNVVLAGGSAPGRTVRREALGDAEAGQRVVSIENVGEVFVGKTRAMSVKSQRKGSR